MNTPRTTAPLGRAALRWVGRLLSLAALGLLAAAVTVVVLIPRATHGQAMTVLTGSMTPGIPVGSVVVVRPVDPGTLQVGDVATYQKDKAGTAFITHRVVDVDTSTHPTTYLFKGDANRGPDLEPIVPDRIVGKVWFHVPYLGTVRDGLKGPGGVTLVAMLLLAVYAASQIRLGLASRQAAPTRVGVDRRLVVASFGRDAHLDPHRLPSHWGAVLVHESSDSFTLVAAPPREACDAVVTELAALAPTTLTITQPAGELVLPPPEPPPPAPTDDAPTQLSRKESLDGVH